MHLRVVGLLLSVLFLAMTPGCATLKESDTSRTGLEQLLISSAADRALDRVNFQPISGAKVFVEAKLLDCVDKNYVILALEQRLMRNQCTLVEKAEDSDVTVAVASGGVGTDRQDLFVGVPEIPLAPPSPVMIPKLTIFNRTRAMGTAKLAVVAYESKSRRPIINEGYSLARADHKNWNILGVGGIQSGTVHNELSTATGDIDSIGSGATEVIARSPLGWTR